MEKYIGQTDRQSLNLHSTLIFRDFSRGRTRAGWEARQERDLPESDLEREREVVSKYFYLDPFLWSDMMLDKIVITRNSIVLSLSGHRTD